MAIVRQQVQISEAHDKPDFPKRKAAWDKSTFRQLSLGPLHSVADKQLKREKVDADPGERTPPSAAAANVR